MYAYRTTLEQWVKAATADPAYYGPPDEPWITAWPKTHCCAIGPSERSHVHALACSHAHSLNTPARSHANRPVAHTLTYSNVSTLARLRAYTLARLQTRYSQGLNRSVAATRITCSHTHARDKQIIPPAPQRGICGTLYRRQQH